MVRFFIGTGGWAYFETYAVDKLRQYSKVFNFVEVNSTFYRYPSETIVKSWRRRVNDDFVFSVKCHRDLTHKYFIRSSEKSFEVFDKMKRICQELRAQILVLQTPYYQSISNENVNEIKDFITSIEKNNLIIAWEVRSRLDSEILLKLQKIFSDHNIVNIRDLSMYEIEDPNEIIYSRIFGGNIPPVEKFDEIELMNLRDKILKLNPKEAYLAFHPRKMYDEAKRFKRLVPSDINSNQGQELAF